jgi:hypothetical protein
MYASTLIHIQGVSKRALRIWKSIQIYTEDIHNVLNSHDVAKHCKLYSRGTVVPNNATTSAPAVEIKMATFSCAKLARCMFWFEETKPATQVQRKFRTQYRKKPPSRPTIYSWQKSFVETGCSKHHAKSPGRPCVSDPEVKPVVESVTKTFTLKGVQTVHRSTPYGSTALYSKDGNINQVKIIVMKTTIPFSGLVTSVNFR